MPERKFKVGDKVRVRDDVSGVPTEWVGVEAKIIQASAEVSGAHSQPIHPSTELKYEWEPLYGLDMEGVEQWVAVRESWLEEL